MEIPNMPLVPENDPTTLFVGNGMQPLVPYLLGEPHPLGTRLVNVQRSFRAEDLDEVGNERHHTLFEMLGCWSLGDYFKEEIIPWTFEFFVGGLGFDVNRLYVSVFAGDEYAPRDEESVEIWKRVFLKYGIEAKDSEDIYGAGGSNLRIFYYPREKNWWERPNAPLGDPAGPDSEIFYDTGKKHDVKFGEKCHLNCDCGRFVEIGNDVFMGYRKIENGYVALEKKNTDVGWGLERITRVVQGKNSNFETDLFWPVIQKIEELSEVKYRKSKRGDWIYRVIADHVRASCFLVADGVEPSNKMQGYVLRRLLRRIIRFSREIGLKEGFLAELAQVVVKIYSQPYPHLAKSLKRIVEVLQKEEKQFQKTLDLGLREFKKLMEEIEREAGGTKGVKEISGSDAFRLYESYGFPFELVVELARDFGISVDKDGFERVRKEAIEKSKSLDKGVFTGGLGDQSEKTVWYHTLTHLLHQALVDVLGDSVQQVGSNITAERMRFDFSHSGKLTDKQIAAVERIVNEKKDAGLPVARREMSLEEAVKLGAKAFFKDKYGEKVSVYSIGDYSMEICGGPHVKNTSEISGMFKIVREESVGEGKRRVRAVLEGSHLIFGLGVTCI